MKKTPIFDWDYFRLNDIQQVRYEIIRAHEIDKLSVKESCKLFNVSIPFFKKIQNRFHKGGIPALLPETRGPKSRREYTTELIPHIYTLREEGLTVPQIQKRLQEEGNRISITTIQDILREGGYPRTWRSRKVPPSVFPNYMRVSTDIERILQEGCRTKFGGLFLFIPFIRFLGIEEVIRKTWPQGTPDLPEFSLAMSIIGLKLIGAKRWSHANDLCDDTGLALFAGLNLLPDQSVIHSRTKKISESAIDNLIGTTAKRLKEAKLLNDDIINFDIHNIPVYSERPEIDVAYVPTRGKAMKVIKTGVIQSQNSKINIHAITDKTVLTPSRTLLAVVNWCDEYLGKKERTYIFDLRAGTIPLLNKLNKRGLKFITLKPRSDAEIEDLRNTSPSDWKRVYIDIPRRKVFQPLVLDRMINLPGYERKIREIVLTENGHPEPVFIITNRMKDKTVSIIKEYAYRWRIENGLSEMIDFFHYNANASLLQVKANINVALTLLADTIYKLFAMEIPGHEKDKPETLFRKFIHHGASIRRENDKIIVRMDYFEKQHLIEGLYEKIEHKNEQLEIKKTIPWLRNLRIQMDFVH